MQQGERVAQLLLMDDRQWLADKHYAFDDGEFWQGQFDGSWFGNALEAAFSRALDKADFVLWWHRNPADVPMTRLLETKDDTKDAARKAQHSPRFYGKVLFLTPDGNRMRWVNDDGSLGAVLDFDDMGSALSRLAETRPT